MQNLLKNFYFTANKDSKFLGIWQTTYINWKVFDYLCCRLEIIIKTITETRKNHVH